MNVVEICMYCEEPAQEKLGCCGEHHFIEVDEDKYNEGFPIEELMKQAGNQ